MLRFQGEEYRAPSSLHTHRKVAQKDPIFPSKATLMSPSTPLHDVNVTSIINIQELTIQIFLYFGKFMF